MYLFPRIEMPEKALKKAEELGKKADVMYALDLLGKWQVYREKKIGQSGMVSVLSGLDSYHLTLY